MRKLLMLVVLMGVGLTFTGCGLSKDEIKDNGSEMADSSDTEEMEESEESEDDSSSQASEGDNVTGGKEVKQLSEDALVITNADGNSILDPVKDDTSDTLDGTGFDVSVQVYDTDGDGLINANRDEEEKFTAVANVANNSGKTYSMDKFEVYCQGCDYQSDVTIENVESEGATKDEFEIEVSNFIKYRNDDTYDSFELEDGESIKVVVTGIASVAYNGFDAADVSFMTSAADEETKSYTVEYTFEALED